MATERPDATAAPEAFLLWHQTQSARPLKAPIGVIGPREARADQLAVAERVGALLGRTRFTLLCGGRSGIMEAAARGASRAGGLTIGLLPEEDPAAANVFIQVPIATGIGEARNAVIARASHCLIAVGDSYGTLSEVAYGLRFEKPVFGLADAARIDGVRQMPDVDALARALAALFAAAA